MPLYRNDFEGFTCQIHREWWDIFRSIGVWRPARRGVERGPSACPSRKTRVGLGIRRCPPRSFCRQWSKFGGFRTLLLGGDVALLPLKPPESLWNFVWIFYLEITVLGGKHLGEKRYKNLEKNSDKTSKTLFGGGRRQDFSPVKIKVK